MCGIAGYIGKERAVEKISDMLKRLEYRGYDSAGIALLDGGLKIYKDRGKVEGVLKKVPPIKGPGVALGHSRWATHGEPSQANAHPHTDNNNELAIVHNGIIENYSELRTRLRKQGYHFTSETDSEVVVHLIKEGLKTKDFEHAFVDAVKALNGSFAIAAIYTGEPDKIMFARNESPLLVGLGKGENFITSDIPAIISETRRFLVVDDMEYGILTKDNVTIRDLRTGREIKKAVHLSDLNIEVAEKGGHKHFMLKEILEESLAVKNALRSRNIIRKVVQEIKDCRSIYLVACGTAWHAGMVARYMFQEYGVPAFAEVASEFRYSTAKTLSEGDVVIFISQSGETADTLAAAKAAKRYGAKAVSIVNVVGSSLTRISDANIYTYSGPEIAVASTKVYLGQLTALTILVLEFLRARGKISQNQLDSKMMELETIPAKIDSILDNQERIKELAKVLETTEDYFYIARRLNYPTAMEGALKLKEISYLHAEAYPGGELKHGPLALMEERVCVVAVNPDDELRKKMDSNIREVRSRRAKVLELCEGKNFAIHNGSGGTAKEAAIRVVLPKTDPLLTPLTMIVPLHLLAYYVALSKNLDIDKPRNLAKSVTVE